MGTEKLEEFNGIGLPIRENKAVEMEIVFRKYEEESWVPLCFTVMMKTVLKCKDCTQRKKGKGKWI